MDPPHTGKKGTSPITRNGIHNNVDDFYSDNPLYLIGKMCSDNNWKAIAFVILFLTLTVILASYVYLNTTPRHPYESKDTPEFETECHKTEDGDFIIEVGEFSRRKEVGVGQSEYFLPNDTGRCTDFGKVSDIYGYDNSFFPANFSFVDSDRSGSISQGDYFILISVENGGKAGPGNAFILKFSETDEVMSRVTLHTSDFPVPDFTPPSSKWFVKEMDEENISLDTSQAASSRFHTLSNRMLFIGMSFSFRGAEITNLTVIFRANEITFHQAKMKGIQNETRHVRSSYNISDNPFNSDDIYSVTIRFSGEILESDSGRSLLRTDFLLSIVRAKQTVPSFSMNPVLISLTLAIVFLTAIARKTKRTNN